MDRSRIQVDYLDDVIMLSIRKPIESYSYMPRGSELEAHCCRLATSMMLPVESRFCCLAHPPTPSSTGTEREVKMHESDYYCPSPGKDRPHVLRLETRVKFEVLFSFHQASAAEQWVHCARVLVGWSG